MNKIKGTVGGKKWESVGDAVLKLVVSELVGSLPSTIHNTDSIGYFTSNDYLCSLRHTVPIRFKKTPNHCVRGSKNYKSKVGDEVEYYIAFLYFNYGLDSARRFILSKISVYIKK